MEYRGNLHYKEKRVILRHGAAFDDCILADIPFIGLYLLQSLSQSQMG
jgi:hypothetical protein